MPKETTRSIRALLIGLEEQSNKWSWKHIFLHLDSELEADWLSGPGNLACGKGSECGE